MRALVAVALLLAVPASAQELPADVDPPERIIPRVRPIADGEHPPPLGPIPADVNSQLAALVAEQVLTQSLLMEIRTEIKRIRVVLEANAWKHPEDKP